MFGLLILLNTFWVGKQLVQLLPTKWYKLEFWSLVYILGTLVLTWFIFISAVIFGYSLGIPIALIITAAGAYFIKRKYHKESPEFVQLTPKIRFNVILHLVFWSILLWFLFTSRLFQIKPDGWYSGGTTWADLALHSTYIHKFAQQQQVDLTSPVYITQKTTYPFLFDFNTALLFRTGFSLQDSLVLTSMLATLSFLTLTFFLMLRTTNSLFVAQLTSILFLFNSNIGTYHFFTEQAASRLSFWQFLQNLTINYVHYPEHELHWAQYITDYILPQRGILIGLGVFVIICYLLYFALQEKKKASRKLLLAAAIITGMMPFFHVHTFFVLIGICGWFVLTSVWTKKTTFSKWVLPLGIVALLAAPQLYWQFSQTFDAGFTHFTQGWYAKDESIIVFWMRNLGLEFFLGIAGIVYLYSHSKTPSLFRVLILPLTALFILCNFIIFQPNDWDNTKFMIYSHFGFTVATILILEKMRKLHIGFIPWVVLAIVVLTSGGALAVVRELETNWQSVTTSEVEMATLVRESTSWDAVFLTSDTHNHPIPMLTGRPIIMGYRGWLWTYGINYRPLEKDVYTMYQGGVAAESLLKKYNVSYVYIGPRELKEFAANESYYQQFPLLYESDSVSIYKISK